MIILAFFKIQRVVEVYRAKTYSSVVFFVKKWSFCLQDSILGYFLVFQGLSELDLTIKCYYGWQKARSDVGCCPSDV